MQNKKLGKIIIFLLIKTTPKNGCLKVRNSIYV